MYVRFVGGKHEEHYLNWAKKFEINLYQAFKVVGEEKSSIEGPHWLAEIPKDWSYSVRPKVLCLYKTSWNLVIPDKSLEEYM